MLALVAVIAATFAVRVGLVVALRRRHPAAAAAIERWWAWVPLVVVAVAISATEPLLGIPLSLAMAWWLTRADAIGSPFRPRR
jgi:hypothetical protein